jgi:periplasmic protein TonB
MNPIPSVLRPAAAVLLPLLAVAACREEAPETPPRQLSSSPFHYPEELWDAGVEGETVLRIFVSAQGSVDTVRVQRGSEYPAFDSSAARGARELRFDPARKGEDPVGVWVLLPVQFNLASGDASESDHDGAVTPDP